MKLMLLATAVALIATSASAQDTKRSGGDTTPPVPAGYQPPPQPPIPAGVTPVYVQAPPANVAYPPPAPLASYPPCRKGQFDKCRQLNDPR